MCIKVIELQKEATLCHVLLNMTVVAKNHAGDVILDKSFKKSTTIVYIVKAVEGRMAVERVQRESPMGEQRRQTEGDRASAGGIERVSVGGSWVKRVASKCIIPCLYYTVRLAVLQAKHRTLQQEADRARCGVAAEPDNSSDASWKVENFPPRKSPSVSRFTNRAGNETKKSIRERTMRQERLGHLQLFSVRGKPQATQVLPTPAASSCLPFVGFLDLKNIHYYYTVVIIIVTVTREKALDRFRSRIELSSLIRTLICCARGDRSAERQSN